MNDNNIINICDILSHGGTVTRGQKVIDIDNKIDVTKSRSISRKTTYDSSIFGDKYFID